MYKIYLINMPFGALNYPSLALTQLKSILDSTYGEQIFTEILYLNHEFVRYLGGTDVYNYPLSMEALVTGLGDWFFRQSAFPGAVDNIDEYFIRFYSSQDSNTQMMKALISQKRKQLDSFLRELIEKYHLREADMVGFTSLFSQTAANIAMAGKLKEYNPRIITVMGGPNCDGIMGLELIKNVKPLDYIFSGPATKNFPQFVRHCLDQEFENCNHIKGVFARVNFQPQSQSEPEAESKPDEGKKSDLVGEELDIDIKIPLNYDSYLELIEKNYQNNEVNPILPFETSRGCWWGERVQCKFCGLNAMKLSYRSMSPQLAIEQFKSLFRYAPRCQHFYCVDNIMPRGFIKEVFPYLDTPAQVTILYEARPHLTGEDLQILSRARVRALQPGIEALNTSILKLMSKGSTAFQNLLLLKNCIRYSIRPKWNLLVGFPGEKEEVYEKYDHDIPLLAHLPPPDGVFPVRFDRYSYYFNHREEYGLDLQPLDYYKFTFPFSQKVLENIAYYFINYNFWADYAPILSKWIGKIQDKVNQWRDQWYGHSSISPPKLFFKKTGDITVVYDSRFNKVTEHPIDVVGKKVLEKLSKPISIDSLYLKLEDVTGSDVDKAVTFLKDRGLLFQEGQRLMSLVLPGDPPPIQPNSRV